MLLEIWRAPETFARLRRHAAGLGHAASLYATGNGEAVIRLCEAGWHVISEARTNQCMYGSWMISPDRLAYPLSAMGRLSSRPIAKVDRSHRVVQWL